jgi:hypothetical protein
MVNEEGHGKANISYEILEERPQEKGQFEIPRNITGYNIKTDFR